MPYLTDFHLQKKKKEADGSYTVTVDVYGDGIDMWLRSQGSYVEVIEDGK